MKIKISFLGAAKNVTGSRHLLEVDGTRILVDCGLYQERDLRDRNWEPFEIPPASINAVLLTHAHLDHCGLLPKLVKEGFNGKVYCTDATAELAQIVLLDSAHIQEEDAAFKKKRHKREGRTPPHPVEPLYTQEDVQECIPLFAPLPYKKKVMVNDCIEISFHDAGHILGSSIIKVKAACNGQTRTILFTGDIGRNDRPILRDPDVFTHADYVLVESTYGDRVHHSVDDVRDKLADVVNSTVQRGGNIVIPSFSIERSQEVLYYLNQLLMEDKIPHVMTVLDSPMAIRATQVFMDHPEMFDEEMRTLLANNSSPFSFKGLKMTLTTRESKALNQVRGTMIIIAGSGMCTGGRIKHHLAANIGRPESTILFVGYQAVGTLGRLIVDGNEEVRILGQMYPVKARIERVHGFSAHAGQDELFAWLNNLKKPPRGVFVVHGEAEAAENFGQYLRDQTGWEVTVPEYKDSIVLD
ncbi:MAG: MBL fold metallo-hydrolase [Sedimentisphaerales bacterium]|nr:MBL fold metallo-hydrolase [Sedimentisphaerales bacterium]